MKNKISFTSVLKSKASVSSKMMNGSSQYSMDSQSRHPHQRLMDIYQQYESYPEQDYTLDFSSMSRNMGYSNGRSRNSSMNMMSRSKNVGNTQDPQMSLQMWIQKQKKGGNNISNGGSSYESFSNNMGGGNITNMSNMMMKPQSQKSFKQTLTLQQQQSSTGSTNSRRSKSNFGNLSNNMSNNNFNQNVNTNTKNNNIYYQQQQL